VIAAAEWLVRRGYTRPHRLALEGQGPAGAGVGGAFTQRPELFAAAIFDVAVADMLRREAPWSASSARSTTHGSSAPCSRTPRRRAEWTDDLVFLGIALQGAGERLERLASDVDGGTVRPR
jgi:hypothetical protein